MHATRRKNLGDTLYIIHIPDVYHQFLVLKGKDIYLKQKNDIEISKNIACERPLWGTLGGKEGQLATTSLEFEFHLQFPSGSTSTELSDFCQSAQSRNKHECKQPLFFKKTHAMGNDVITCVISADQHFASTFSIQIFKFQRLSCKLFFLFPPCCQSTPKSLHADRLVSTMGALQILLTKTTVRVGEWPSHFV